MTAARNEVRNWRADALCAQVDPDLFFPETDRGAAFERQATAAMRVCAGCPVREKRVALARQGVVHPDAGRLGPRPPSGNRERAGAGGLAAASGGRAEELRLRLGVGREPARRWGADPRRTARTAGVGEGSPAATGTPLQISIAREALAGNAAPEGI